VRRATQARDAAAAHKARLMSESRPYGACCKAISSELGHEHACVVSRRHGSSTPNSGKWRNDQGPRRQLSQLNLSPYWARWSQQIWPFALPRRRIEQTNV
jgi:hypothetical protein